MNSNLLQSFGILIHFKQPSSGNTRLFQTDFMCRIEERCDQISHCKDKSDENNCKLIVFEDNYNNKVPPFTINKDKSVEAVKVKVSTSLMNILAISEFDHTIHLKLGITLKWYENRVLYHNLKMKEALNTLTDAEVAIFTRRVIMSHYIQVNMLWIPYIIFKNTDSDEAVMIDGELRTLVAVTREGGFVRSGPEVADEVRKVEMSSIVTLKSSRLRFSKGRRT